MARQPAPMTFGGDALSFPTNPRRARKRERALARNEREGKNRARIWLC